jgi:16S rRNA (guanine966-N2)-methyltransferase
MDRIKGAVFSSLGDLVPGAVVLDLFAGSGAMGIEALSRGAATAVLVDSNERCIRCIHENLQMAGVSANVQTMDVYRFLDLFVPPESFDIIFADPPYSKKPEDVKHAEALVASLKLAAALKPGGLFVLEKQAAGTLDESVFEVIKAKRYGGSEILYLAKK